MSTISSIIDCAITIPVEIAHAIFGPFTSFFLSFTLNQLWIASMLLPLYLIIVLFRVLPPALRNFQYLFSASGRSTLIRTAVFHRKKEEQQARLQFEGRFAFPEKGIFRVKPFKAHWMNDLPWENETEEFSVCGATVRFVHLKPLVDGDSGKTKTKKNFLFLHGKPGWSYVWRNVLPSLIREGHEVYALDWLDHGRSDKIIYGKLVSFELHMRTLISFFGHTKLKNTIIVAHDWGGCIALCTMPHLPATACDKLFLLDSFFPPRPDEVSTVSYLFYLVWYLSTGILGGAFSASIAVRLLCPQLSVRDSQGYGAPYRGLPLSAKSTEQRFTYLVPLTPRYVLRHLRETTPWKLLEGFLGPENFSNLNAQTRLAVMDDDARSYWKSRKPDKFNQGTEKGFKIAVAYGERDPLLNEDIYILALVINRRYLTDCIWRLKRAGHYLMEERPYEVVNLIQKVADT